MALHSLALAVTLCAAFVALQLAVSVPSPHSQAGTMSKQFKPCAAEQGKGDQPTPHAMMMASHRPHHNSSVIGPITVERQFSSSAEAVLSFPGAQVRLTPVSATMQRETQGSSADDCMNLFEQLLRKGALYFASRLCAEYLRLLQGRLCLFRPSRQEVVLLMTAVSSKTF